jgi:hypothetical protein
MTHGAGPDPGAIEEVMVSLQGKLTAISLVQLENAFGLMWAALDDANGQIDHLMAEL